MNVTASMERKSYGLCISNLIYSIAKVNVFPLPALALYTIRGLFIIINMCEGRVLHVDVPCHLNAVYYCC